MRYLQPVNKSCITGISAIDNKTKFHPDSCWPDSRSQKSESDSDMQCLYEYAISNNEESDFKTTQQ